jgi:hypothetical protein
MFPVGWYHFLHSLLAGNPFSDVVSQVEMFDEEASLDTIVPMLTGDAERTRVEEARQAYLAALRRLPDVATIVREVATGVPA